MNAHLICLLLSAVCFLVAAFELPVPRINLMSFGLFLLAVSMLLV